MDRRQLIRLSGAVGAVALGAAAAVRGCAKSAPVAGKAPLSNCDVYQGSVAGWNVWTADRRDRDYRAEPAKAIGEVSSNLELVERLLASYRRTFKKAHYGSMWGAIFGQNHLPIHQVFMSGPRRKQSGLRDPPARLHNGMIPRLLTLQKSTRAKRHQVMPKLAR